MVRARAGEDFAALAFEFDPAPDTYRVEGPPFALQIGDRFFAHPGAYTMIADKEGYRHLETTFTVGSDRNQEVSFFLKQSQLSASRP